MLKRADWQALQIEAPKLVASAEIQLEFSFLLAQRPPQERRDDGA